MTRRSLTAVGVAVLGLLGLVAVACGGNDKPPLTPDNADGQPTDAADGAAPAPPK